MPEDPPPSLRERKKQQTRDTLTRVAMSMFREHGFVETTVEAIAAAADVSPRTFFRYFETKEDVVFSGTEEHVGVLRECIARRPPAEPAPLALREALLSFAEYVEAHREKLLAQTQVMASHPPLQLRGLGLEERFLEVLATELAAREGHASPELRTWLLASIGLSALFTASHLWRESRQGSDLGQLLERTFEVVHELAGAEGLVGVNTVGAGGR